MSIRYIPGFFGLGFGSELVRLRDIRKSCWAIHCKVFIGPVVIHWTINITREKIDSRIKEAIYA
jgi:hypothetical protein